MKRKAANFFWPSFTDLMTTLFFVVLVLYVITIQTLKSERDQMEKERNATKEQLKKIQEIQKAGEKLNPAYFIYDSTYKRFSINRKITFEMLSDVIRSEEDKQFLISVGRELQKLVESLRINQSELDVRYVLLVEGMSSDIPIQNPDDLRNNDNLSYRRALALWKLWKAAGIQFDHGICEIQVSGSGIDRGIGRSSIEIENQRILIHIIPKIGNITSK